MKYLGCASRKIPFSPCFACALSQDSPECQKFREGTRAYQAIREVEGRHLERANAIAAELVA